MALGPAENYLTKAVPVVVFVAAAELKVTVYFRIHRKSNTELKLDISSTSQI